MPPILVLALLGPDRPGLVEEVADLIHRHGGNWLQSRLAHLSGHFAGLVEFSLPDGHEEAFRAALPELESRAGLQCRLSAGTPRPPSGPLVSLECVGQDRPGIVFALSDVLADFGVNVEEMETACASAPMSGEPLFTARLRVSLPEGLDMEALERRLSDIGDELMLDVDWGVTG